MNSSLVFSRCHSIDHSVIWDYNQICNDYNIFVLGRSGVKITMESPLNESAAELARRNIRPSRQRIKILEYLIQKPCHPTVDQIYGALHPEMPSLSKTTIYNTLTTFQQAALVRVLSIEEHETRYDILMENHGHFKCEICGKIINFKIDIDRFPADELKDCKIDDKNVYFKGICPQCLAKEE